MVESVRQYCLSFPQATENVQWGNDLVFKVSGKIFAIVNLEPKGPWLCFKCDPERFAELIEREGIRPAPYLARAKWVAVDRNAMDLAEIKTLIRQSHDLICAKLPKKVRAELMSD